MFSQLFAVLVISMHLSNIAIFAETAFMKKAKAVNKDPENFAFDDDTSDSDDDQVQAFNSKVGDLKPLFGNQAKTSSEDLPDAGTESDSSDEDEEDDSEESGDATDEVK